MTYREVIQQLIAGMEGVFEATGEMRDLATLEEQAYWNQARAAVAGVLEPLSKLDNSLPDIRAQFIID